MTEMDDAQRTVTTRDRLADPARKRLLNEEIFTVVAPRYGLITRLLSFGRDARWKRHLVAALPELPRPTCLDLACGTADLTMQLAAKFPHGTVLGLDLTESMLEIARRRCQAPNVQFVRGDMGSTGLPSGSVDIVTGGYALRNAPDLTEALREIRRVLKPGGTAAFLDFSKPPNRLVQRAELFLLTVWGGFWGLLLHRDPSVYTYIAESLRMFPDRNRLTELFDAAGFRPVQVRYFFGGIMELRIVQTPPRDPAA